jgi:hypothetical protein
LQEWQPVRNNAVHKFRLAFLTLALSTSFAACSAETESSSGTEASTRGPLGKADAAGSCETTGGDLCGDIGSNGTCWCDDACAQWGDCCADKASVCDGTPDLCEDFVGPCQTDADCDAGSVCVADPDTCSPSNCGCDPATGSILCTADCGGKECVPAAPDLCEDFVAPCQTDADCDADSACITDPETCTPSACGCDPATGSIVCTADCGGSECVPA